jgi:hypothetical protein
MEISDTVTPQVAYYYPNATWRYGSTGFIKNLILYFDGVGLLVPDYIRDKPFVQDPELASALRDHGLLHVLSPETLVTKRVTEQLATSVTEVLSTGALDNLGQYDGAFHELSFSRLGSYGDAGLAEMLYEELKQRGLAKPSVDGVSIPMHPLARSMVLVVLAQILRANSESLGFALCPATDRGDVVDALSHLLNAPQLPTAGQVVSSDLKHLGVDLSEVPITQVLNFRNTHGKELREYAREVRGFTRQLSALAVAEREEAFLDRRLELDKRAVDISKRAASYWKQPTAFYLSVLAATASLAEGNPAAALFSLGGAFATFSMGERNDGGAYSYLFRARQIQA